MTRYKTFQFRYNVSNQDLGSGFVVFLDVMVRSYSMQKLNGLMIWCAVLILSACSGNPAIPGKSESHLTFFDSRVFDETLESSLEESPEQLTITSPQAFGLNAVPDRLELWVSAVKEYGGTVQVEQDGEGLAKKGFLLDGLDLILRSYEEVRNMSMYGGVEGYDITLFHDAEGKVSRLVLSKRKPS